MPYPHRVPARLEGWARNFLWQPCLCRIWMGTFRHCGSTVSLVLFATNGLNSRSSQHEAGSDSSTTSFSTLSE